MTIAITTHGVYADGRRIADAPPLPEGFPGMVYPDKAGERLVKYLRHCKAPGTVAPPGGHFQEWRHGATVVTVPILRGEPIPEPQRPPSRLEDLDEALYLGVDMGPQGWRVLHASRGDGYAYDTDTETDTPMGWWHAGGGAVGASAVVTLEELSALVWGPLTPCKVRPRKGDIATFSGGWLTLENADGTTLPVLEVVAPYGRVAPLPLTQWRGVALHHWRRCPLLVVEVSSKGRTLRRFVAGLED